jgi:hypothetical protein
VPKYAQASCAHSEDTLECAGMSIKARLSTLSTGCVTILAVEVTNTK